MAGPYTNRSPASMQSSSERYGLWGGFIPTIIKNGFFGSRTLPSFFRYETTLTRLRASGDHSRRVVPSCRPCPSNADSYVHRTFRMRTSS